MILYVSADPVVNSVPLRPLNESDFRILSRDIIGNRKLISELKSAVRDLERRIWELEGHSPIESLQKAKDQLDEWSAMAEELSINVGENR